MKEKKGGDTNQSSPRQLSHMCAVFTQPRAVLFMSCLLFKYRVTKTFLQVLSLLSMDCISHLIDWKILSSRQHNTDTMRIQRTVANVW